MNVIGVFPNAGSVVRLVGALLMEENDRWAAMSKAYYSTDVAELEGRLEELAGVARERARLMLVGWPAEKAVANLRNNLDLTFDLPAIRRKYAEICKALFRLALCHCINYDSGGLYN